MVSPAQGEDQVDATRKLEAELRCAQIEIGSLRAARRRDGWKLGAMLLLLTLGSAYHAVTREELTGERDMAERLLRRAVDEWQLVVDVGEKLASDRDMCQSRLDLAHVMLQADEVLLGDGLIVGDSISSPRRLIQLGTNDIKPPKH